MKPGLKVIAPGTHSSVQDPGRFGYQAQGVPVSGVLDRVALRLANGLVGNAPDMAALEILFSGPTLEVTSLSLRIALAGTNAMIEILSDNPRSVPGWRSLVLRQGETFRIGGLPDSSCAILAIEGGIAVEPFLGSASTYARGGFGGFQGRTLRSGDLLPLARGQAGQRGDLCLPSPPDSGRDQPIRVMLGPQQDSFTEEAVKTLLGAPYRVSVSSDRMGMRLDGPRLAHRGDYNIVSDGVPHGAIQVPGTGEPILLLADHQTTGGYPKIATVASVDLPTVGRRRPGDVIKFTAVSVAEAENLRHAQEAEMNRLIATMTQAPPLTGLDHAALYRDNLVSGVTDGFE